MPDKTYTRQDQMIEIQMGTQNALRFRVINDDEEVDDKCFLYAEVDDHRMSSDCQNESRPLNYTLR